ncbi:C40 family peptidase [Bordetella genomosp. 6]|uniref:C40 family peptidase n=1 Tax=Bordetella genomosp. 6 TaxID=463024 RepID=UPI000A28FF08|nr:C40 family peptidase [Bordetella genomosp. 6]ARP75785.1 hypothetical protein CAL11_06345 [Bordetella genomosp. 6]
MHRHSNPALPERNISLSSRGLRLLAVVACAVGLAGCAGTGAKKTSYTFESDPDDTEWVASADDPIGILVTQKLKRERRAGVSQANGENPLVSEALGQLGVRYRFGGISPDTGFDCSGLVAYTAERSLGLKLPRISADIARWGTNIDRKELRPGDLVFFNTLGRRYSHVGIYMGENRFIHSPSSGGVVRVENMTVAYWAKRYNGARRIDDSRLASARASN